MEYVHCNLCGCDDSEVVNQGPDLLLNRPGHFTLVRCRHCGLIYQNPRVTAPELSAYYPDEYLPYREEPTSLVERFNAAHALNRRCSQLMKHHPQVGTLLDVGCATGHFLNAMQERGWRVSGVELNGYAADYARKTFDLEIFTGTLAEAVFPESSFDVVTMWDVLEHVPDPKETLAEIARILKPGGLLALSLPNPQSVEARVFGDSWIGWDRPRHLFLFTPPVLRQYLSQSHLELSRIESLGGRLGLTLLSVEFLCKKHEIPESIWKPVLRLLYNPLLRLITWPLYRLGEKVNRTTSMTVFARYPGLESRP